MKKWERDLAKKMKRDKPKLRKYSDEALINWLKNMRKDIKKQSKGQKTSEEE